MFGCTIFILINDGALIRIPPELAAITRGMALYKVYFL